MRNHHAMYLYSMLIPEWPKSFYKTGSKGYWSRRSFWVRPSRCAYRCSDKRPAAALTQSASFAIAKRCREPTLRGKFSRSDTTRHLQPRQACAKLRKADNGTSLLTNQKETRLPCPAEASDIAHAARRGGESPSRAHPGAPSCFSHTHGLATVSHRHRKQSTGRLLKVA